MRYTILLLPFSLVLSSCTMPSIPAPWEAAENPGSEPLTALAAAPLPQPTWQRIGSSIRGKDIHAATFGEGPRRIYLIGGVHGDQPEGPAAADKLAELLRDAAPEQVTIRVVRDMNPDGTAARTRFNTRGVDLNRNWPATDYQKGEARHGVRAASELETTLIQKDLLAFKPDIVVVLTSSVRGPAVAFEGLNQVQGFEFASGARREDPRWRLVPDRWKSSPGSVESYARLNMKRSVISVELRRGSDADANARALAAGLSGLAQAK